MIRQQLMSTVLGAALAAAPASADDPKPQPPKADAAALEALKKDVDTLRDDIKKLQTFRKDLEDVVYGKKDGGTGADIGLMSKLDRLDQSIKRLDEQLAKLGDPKSTTVLRPETGSAPAASGPPGATTNVSHVRIVNDYPVEMSMIVNRKSYRVGPGETRTVDVPPGSYTYELLTAGSQPTTSQIKDNETVTLRIR